MLASDLSDEATQEKLKQRGIDLAQVVYLQKCQRGEDPVDILNDMWSDTDFLATAETVNIARQWLPAHIAFDQELKTFRRRDNGEEVRVPADKD